MKFDQEMLRPSEVDLLVGDPGKASRELAWRATTSFEDLVRIMVENDLNLVKKSN